MNGTADWPAFAGHSNLIDLFSITPGWENPRVYYLQQTLRIFFSSLLSFTHSFIHSFMCPFLSAHLLACSRCFGASTPSWAPIYLKDPAVNSPSESPRAVLNLIWRCVLNKQSWKYVDMNYKPTYMLKKKRKGSYEECTRGTLLRWQSVHWERPWAEAVTLGPEG